ncbi:hypothetical protein CDD81_6732 [Ophiocordyceps australis]|uniref:Uncharacterized protein n=1 Tax=Ophiocordyceps australis TaxID=1399860 RepID=A0A2C5Y716_9HYPO|nr:hypothetical protein CDD81_6732 [Ophiocordyceps australis]
MATMISLTRRLAARNAVFTTRPLPPCRKPLARRQFHLGVSILGKSVVWTAKHISAFYHVTGIPWFIMIPLAAVAVGAVVRLPCSILYYRLRRRREELKPLIDLSCIYNRIKATRKHKNDRIAWDKEVAKLDKESRRDIYKSFGVGHWNFYLHLTVVPFVIVSEALRKLCGSPGSWLAVQLGLEKGSQGARAAVTRPLFEASLTDGGCLWFPDLTVMDPYFILPLICSIVFARQIWARMPRERLLILLGIGNKPEMTSSTTRMVLGRVLGRAIIMTPAIPLALADLPSAVMLFWISSSLVGDAISSMLRAKYQKRGIELTYKSKVKALKSYIPRDPEPTLIKQK